MKKNLLSFILSNVILSLVKNGFVAFPVMLCMMSKRLSYVLSLAENRNGYCILHDIDFF